MVLTMFEVSVITTFDFNFKVEPIFWGFKWIFQKYKYKCLYKRWVRIKTTVNKIVHPKCLTIPHVPIKLDF